MAAIIPSMKISFLAAALILCVGAQAQQGRSGQALPPPDLPRENTPPLISADESAGIDDQAAQSAIPQQPESSTSGEPQAGTPARTSGAGQSVQFQENDQTRPGELPPKVGGEQPPADVNIRRSGGSTLEEYSVNGRVYMVRVVPDQGVPYYILDADGDGRLESRMAEENMTPVSPVTYKLFEWD